MQINGENNWPSQVLTASRTGSSRRYTAGGWDARAGEPGARVRAGHRQYIACARGLASILRSHTATGHDHGTGTAARWPGRCAPPCTPYAAHRPPWPPGALPHDDRLPAPPRVLQRGQQPGGIHPPVLRHRPSSAVGTNSRSENVTGPIASDGAPTADALAAADEATSTATATVDKAIKAHARRAS